MILVLFIILILVLINALYVAAEFATVAVKTVRIKALAEADNQIAKKLLPHLTDATSLDRYVAACQIGITVSSLLLGAYGQKRLAALLEPLFFRFVEMDASTAASFSATVILILLTGAQVVLGELLPKAIALRFPEKVSLALTYPMLLSLWIFHWFIIVLNGSGNILLRLFKVPTVGHRHVHSPEELQQMVGRDAESVDLEESERLMMDRVFRFGNHSAQNIMVSRTKVVGVDLQSELEDVLTAMEESRFTRFPVFAGQADSVEGYLHIRDVTRALAKSPNIDLRALVRPVIYAPANQPVDHLLERMRAERTHMMVLLDEFGGTAGIVTMEDVVAEVMGEMKDEFAQRESRILEKGVNGWLVRGSLMLDDLCDESGWKLNNPPASTVGGLIMHLLGRSARYGDAVTYSGRIFTVRRVQGNRISRVRITDV